MTNPRRVVCAIDSQMTYALAVLLGSLARSRSVEFRVTVGYLEDTLPPSDRELIATVAEEFSIELDFMPLSSHPLFIAQGHISPTTFTSFFWQTPSLRRIFGWMQTPSSLRGGSRCSH